MSADQQQGAFGRFAQFNGLAVGVFTRALAAGSNQSVADLDDPDPIFLGVASATLKALFLEATDPSRGKRLGQSGSGAQGHGFFIQEDFGVRRSNSASMVLKRSSGRSIGTMNLNRVAPSNL